MKLIACLPFVQRHLTAAPWRSTVVVLATAVAAAIWIVAVTAASVLLNDIAPQVEAAFPGNRLVARPQEMSLLMFQVGPSHIPDALFEEVSNWPGVEYAARQAPLTFPVQAEIEILGNVIGTDAVVCGVDAELVADNLAAGKQFEYWHERLGPIPVMASRYFLDMYNIGYAPSQGLPRFNESAAIGMKFDLLLGDSIAIGPSAKSKRVTCEIVGLTRDVNLICVVLPIEYATRWNDWFHGKPSSGSSALHVSVASSEAFVDVEKRLVEKGLRVESQRETLDRARLLLRSATAGAIGFALLVVGLAGVSLWQAFTLLLMQQHRDIGLLRAIGATPSLVFGLFAIEALALATAGCVLGTMGGAGAILVLRGVTRSAVNSFDFLGEFSVASDTMLALSTLPAVVVLIACFAAPQILRSVRRPITELLQ